MAYRDSEKHRAYVKRWRAANKAKIREQGIQRNKRPEVKIAAKLAASKYWGSPKGRTKMLWHAAKRRAQEKGLEFSLTLTWVRERLDRGACEVTGLHFNWEDRRSNEMNGAYAPSIDRRDATGGYTPDNCRVVVWALNCALGQWGEEIFAVIAKAYAESEWLR